MILPFFFSAAALAGTQQSGMTGTQEDAGHLRSKAFSALHAVTQVAINVSDLAAEKAKSELVKEYAQTVSSGNADAR